MRTGNPRTGNLGCALRRRRRTGAPMADYDRLPPALRGWLAAAALPWSPRSARRAFARALSEARGDPAAALAALDRLEARRRAAEAGRARAPGPIG